MLASGVGLAVLVPAAPAAYAAGTTFTYTGGEQTYTVPLGVTSVTIDAVGAPGGVGDDDGYPAGDGASVTATVAVSPGETLYVEVGGAGVTGPCVAPGTSGHAFNGGGSTPCGGGGGGASDVRTCSMTACPSLTPDTRLVVAGGGGGSGYGQCLGAGGTAGDTLVTGAGYGGNGALTCPGPIPGGDGGFGPPVGTGGAGVGLGACHLNGSGSLGQGGDAPEACDPSNFGGGGGGGYDGGGAGGDGLVAGGGGGAGSSFWIPSATDTSMTEDTTGTPQVTITPGTVVAGSEVHAVIEVETSPVYAGDSVTISSTQLQLACGGAILFETLQGGSTLAPTTSPDAISVLLDDDGNVTVVVDGDNCAPGTDLIEADMVKAPYLTATATLVVDPPHTATTFGLSAAPANEVETGDSPTTGESDVYTVFQVSSDPVYAEQPVEITSPELENRCNLGWRWEPGSGNAVNQTSGTTVATGTLDDDGNATFVFKGESCAPGTSTVTATVEAGTDPTYTTTYTIDPPALTLASHNLAATTKKPAKAPAPKSRRRHHRPKGTAPAPTPPLMTVTASPNPVVETGGEESATLNIVKSDDAIPLSGTSGPPPVTGKEFCLLEAIDYTITVTNPGSTSVDDVVVDDIFSTNPDFESDGYTSSTTGGATDTDPSGTGSGYNDITDTVDLPAGSSITYAVDAAFYPADGSLTNTATLTPPPYVALTSSSNVSATDNDTILCI
jgi:uncharacterized repeat protein (TIGR01451 family)